MPTTSHRHPAVDHQFWVVLGGYPIHPKVVRRVKGYLSMENDYSIDSNFFEAIIKEDELGCVVRAHLHIEYLIDHLLAVHFEDVSALRPMRLEYSDRVRLLKAFGYEANLTGQLLMLGTLRNDFAHKLDAKLTTDRLESLYKAFDVGSKKMLHDIYRQTRERAADASRFPSSLKKLSPKDLFAFYATTARASLIAAYFNETGKFPPGIRPRTQRPTG